MEGPQCRHRLNQSALRAEQVPALVRIALLLVKVAVPVSPLTLIEPFRRRAEVAGLALVPIVRLSMTAAGKAAGEQPLEPVAVPVFQLTVSEPLRRRAVVGGLVQSQASWVPESFEPAFGRRPPVPSTLGRLSG